MYSGAKGGGGLPASVKHPPVQPNTPYFPGGLPASAPLATRSLAGFQQRHLAAGTVEYGAECA